MKFYTENNKESFLNRLAILENAIANRHLVNKRLEVVAKWGFRWVILCLLKPFYLLFNQDVFSHVRVNQVAKSLLAYFKANQIFLNEETVNRFKQRFLDRLHKKNSSFLLTLNDFEAYLPLPPLKWPSNLDALMITPAQKKEFEQAFLRILPSSYEKKYHFVCTKNKIKGVTIRKLQCYESKTKKLISEIEVPLSVKIEIKTPRNESHVFLFTKAVVAKGGQRRVKKCYDVLTGRFVVRKKICSKIEELILKHYKNVPSLGIEPIRYFINDTSQGFKNSHMIQDYFEVNLFDLLAKVQLDATQVFSIMWQLSTGLANLHVFAPNECFVFNNNFIKSVRKITYPQTFHSDIKPENILVRRLPGQKTWEAVLADFGLAGSFFPGFGTMGYLSPEDIKLKFLVREKFQNSQIPDQVCSQIISQTRTYSQKKDVWALGLVFTALLTNNICSIHCKLSDKVFKLIHVPPLEFLINQFRQYSNDKELSDLPQELVNQNIMHLKNQTPEIYANLWDNLIVKMLQVDPIHRINASEVLKILYSNKI